MSEPANEPQSEKEPKPWQFQKGQSGNPGGKAKDADLVVGMPPLLSAMYYVSRTDKERADHGLRKYARKLLKDDPPAFLKQLQSLELAWMKTREKVKDKERPGVAPEADEKDEELKELLTTLIGEFK